MKGNTTRPTRPERVTVLAKVLPCVDGGLDNIGQSAARGTGHLRHIFKRCLGLGYNINNNTPGYEDATYLPQVKEGDDVAFQALIAAAMANEAVPSVPVSIRRTRTKKLPQGL